MINSLRARIAESLDRAEKASERLDSYPFLPEIREILKGMLARPTMAANERERLSAALGRLVTEDFTFSESEMGTTLLELADDFASSRK
jgi:hypothetical protein